MTCVYLYMATDEETESLEEQQEEKLFEIMKEHDVHITKKGMICLEDFVDNVIGSKNPEQYMKKVDDKRSIKGKYYIDTQQCMGLLKGTKFRKCKQIVADIEKEEDDHENIIDPKKNIFQYDGHRFLAFFVPKEDDDWDVWIKGSDVAKFLGYKNDKQAVRIHVQQKNKMDLEDFLEYFPMLGNTTLKNGKKLDKKTNFINLSGFFNLIHHSHKQIAKEIKSWLDNEVSPMLVKYGSYNMQPNKIDIKLFYDNNALSTFYNKNVLYIGYIGQYKNKHQMEHIFKFGVTSRIFERDYNEHSKFFARFDVVFVGESDNNQVIEQHFKRDLIMMGLYREHTIDKKNVTELFTISQKHTIESLIDHLKILIETHKLPALKEADDKIHGLNTALVHYQQSEKLKELELRYKMSENYKLELAMKKYDVKLRKLDLALEREKNRRKQTESDSESYSDHSKFNDKKAKIIKKRKFDSNSESDSSESQTSESNEENDIYLQYLAERTEKADTHIHTSVLYNDFKRWFSSNNPTSRIPSNKIFVTGLRNNIIIEKVRVDGKSTIGTKNRKIRTDDLDIVEV